MDDFMQGQGGRWLEHPLIDLEIAHFVNEVKGIVVIGTWFYGTKELSAQPCLALLDRMRQPSEQSPYIILLQNKYIWDEAKLIGDSREMMRTAADAAETLGLNRVSKRDLFRVIDAVRLRLRDLQDIPPPPERRKAHIGEAAITINGVSFERDVEL